MLRREARRGKRAEPRSSTRHIRRFCRNLPSVEGRSAASKVGHGSAGAPIIFEAYSLEQAIETRVFPSLTHRWKEERARLSIGIACQRRYRAPLALTEIITVEDRKRGIQIVKCRAGVDDPEDRVWLIPQIVETELY